MLSVAFPEASSGRTNPTGEPASKNVTSPVGVPLVAGVAVAVKVTVWLITEAIEETASPSEVPALLTTCEMDGKARG